MEKISKKIHKYEAIIIDLLHSIKSDDPDYYLVIDKQNRHYQLFTAGWGHNNAYFCRILMHFHLRQDGIICIFENHTEVEAVDEFMEHGVPKSDILLRFLPKEASEYAGYAVA